MPIYTDPAGGGGTPLNICAISPSDMAGNIDNILSRLEELEQEVAELKAQNTSAIQLSDISDNVGWVYNVTYMGVEGWTQTQAGTLIPPAGFTVSQILADAQNRDQLSTSGGGGGVLSYLVTQPSTTSLSANKPAIDDVLFTYGSALGIGDLGDGQINIVESGYYRLSVHLCVSYSAGAAVKKMTISVIGPNFQIVDDVSFNSATDTSNRNVLAADFGFEANAGSHIEIEFTGVLALDATFFDDSIVTIEKLRSI